jgi:cytoskeleton protein RodZ
LEPLEEKKIPEPQTAVEEKEAAKLGSLLRERREKMNLSHDQIGQKIRLRRAIIQAMESEAWEQLPPPVFVRGFLRSYASILGLDEVEVMKLYRQAAPPEPEILKPLPARRKSSRAPALVVLLILAAAACVFYFRRVQSTAPDGAVKQSPPGVEAASPAPGREDKSGNGQKTVASFFDAGVSGTAKSEVSESPPKEVISSEAVSPPASAPEKETSWMILKGAVKEETWVSVSVDGKEKGEFIFQKGAKPEWKAKKSFEVVIGNGSGMDFDLDGKKIENLGKPGEVVRLSLP